MDGDWEQLARDAEVVIVGKRIGDPVRLAQVVRADQLVIDLVGLEALGSAVRPWSGSPAPRAASGASTGA